MGAADTETPWWPTGTPRRKWPRESRHSYQLARILTFKGNRALGLGRFSAARDLFERAHELFDDHARPWEGLRYLNDSMSFYASLGAWGMVDRLAVRASAVLGSADRIDLITGVHAEQHRDLVARSHAAQGRFRESIAIRREIARAAPERLHPVQEPSSIG